LSFASTKRISTSSFFKLLAEDDDGPADEEAEEEEEDEEVHRATFRDGISSSIKVFVFHEIIYIIM
jgi:hypothetical protein